MSANLFDIILTAGTGGHHVAVSRIRFIEPARDVQGRIE